MDCEKLKSTWKRVVQEKVKEKEENEILWSDETVAWKLKAL